MAKPVVVLISDIHYNIHTLPLADAAMRQAITKANDLVIPLIVAGDLHDTKASMRAECVNAMIETFKLCKLKAVVLVGNHDKINEKSSEHSLNFLAEYVNFIIENPNRFVVETDDGPVCLGYLIPYYSDPEALKNYLKRLPKGSRLIMHQGLKEANAGDYIQDKSALTYTDVKDFRVISGHYHTRQDIRTGRPQQSTVGLFSYIGNPYTLGFGEAKDPAKGFQILMDDGTLEFVPTNLRKHIIYETTWDELHSLDNPLSPPGKDDLLWIKLTATKEQLSKVTRYYIEEILSTGANFRLDLIPLETVSGQNVSQSPELGQPELLDKLIDSLSNTSDDRKARLKELWRNSASN